MPVNQETRKEIRVVIPLLILIAAIFTLVVYRQVHFPGTNTIKAHIEFAERLELGKPMRSASGVDTLPHVGFFTHLHY